MQHARELASSTPRPIFANFTERMTERNAKIGPGTVNCMSVEKCVLRTVLVRMR